MCVLIKKCILRRLNKTILYNNFYNYQIIFKMNKLGLLVAIFGLAILTSCGGGEATEQATQDQTQQTEQVQSEIPAADPAALDSTSTEVK
jgi:hypothetical protein